MSTDGLDLKEILASSIGLARQAGAIILEGSDAIMSSGSPENVEGKLNSTDVVTKYDKSVEELIRASLKKLYPTFEFVGEEETSAAGRLPPLMDDPTFCVDPIDGTLNFVHGFPWSCVSIALIHKKHAVLGVIFNPFLDWLYFGVKSQGSYLIKNGGPPQRLPLFPPRPLPSLSQAMIAVEWGSGRGPDQVRFKAESFSRLVADPTGTRGGKMVHALRSMGSAALNIAAVASGSLDMYWEIGCWPWDVAAGIVILEEAGGMLDTSDLSLNNGEVTGDSSDKVLTGRKYVLIRAIADNQTETGRDAQKRLMKEFCETVVNFEAS